MKLSVVLISIFLACTALSQTPKALSKVIPFEVVYLPAESHYPLKTEGDVIFYPSWTLKDDTTGASSNLEYLMFRDSVSYAEDEAFKLFRKDWVLNYEWDNFLNWVVDSIMREQIYINSDPTGNFEIEAELISKMLRYEDVYYDEANETWTSFDPYQPFINRELFPFDWSFNWRKKINPGQYIPLIDELYVSPHERHNRAKVLDKRKFNYAIFRDSRSKVLGLNFSHMNVSRDQDSWAAESKYMHDISYNLALFYNEANAYLSFPVQGVLGTQIKAYLHYKEKKLQKKIDEAGLAYKVRLALPTLKEIETACDCENERPGFITEEKDMTEHWKITNQEYKEFLAAVEDSIVREVVYSNSEGTISSELIGSMLNHPTVYYDEVNLSWVEFDPGQPFFNRGLFNMDPKFKWRKKIDSKLYEPIIEDLYDQEGFKRHLYFYKYEWQDLNRRAQLGELYEEEFHEEPEHFSWYESKDPWNGRSLGLHGGVRRHRDLSLFNVNESINVYPGVNCQECNQLCFHEHGKIEEGVNRSEICDKYSKESLKEIVPYDFDSEPEALIQQINYDQAKAFYHWKYFQKVQPTKKDAFIQHYLFPSQEEFKKVQAGETVINAKEEISFPTPLFRYVIHVYNK